MRSLPSLLAAVAPSPKCRVKTAHRCAGARFEGEVSATRREPMSAILIIDDAAENLVPLSGLMKPQYRVLAVSSGAAALRVAASQPRPVLILLDVMMPCLDDFAVLGQLCEQPAAQDIPVIMLTALADVGEKNADCA